MLSVPRTITRVAQMPKLVSDGLTASEFQAIKSSSGDSGSANSGPKIQVPHIATVPSLKFDLCNYVSV